MAVVTMFDMLVGDTEQLTIHDQSGVPFAAGELAFAYDAGIGTGFTVSPSMSGYTATAISACAGAMTVTATRGSQTFMKQFQVVVSAPITDIVIETAS